MGCQAHGLCFHTAACPLCPGSPSPQPPVPHAQRATGPASTGPTRRARWLLGHGEAHRGRGLLASASATCKWAPVASGHFSELLETVGPMEPRVRTEPCPGRLREEEVEGGQRTEGPGAQQRRAVMGGGCGEASLGPGPPRPCLVAVGWAARASPGGRATYTGPHLGGRRVSTPTRVPVRVSAAVPGATGRRAPCPSLRLSYECCERTATAVSLHEGAPP